ncbi:YxeA family protein [Geomicrobium sp. JCM 19055]|uniref:YxeA family protein n=1 Tax=Geomicrobium sp. JCM 19055 TaxID=1460649 RepID=UPI00045ED4A4|nr:YxeA family protein [Geomicrobium sp. JCM 19055]GAJ98557.1 hypothetical protein JCM19055_1497 [Geomicrobium sp. JCM 19055]
MRKALIIILTIVTATVGLIFLFTMLVQHEFADQLNPFVPEEDVYVIVEGEGEELGSGRVEYTLTGITEDGEEREVTFTASAPLREGATLRLETKRTYVKSWEEVDL